MKAVLLCAGRSERMEPVRDKNFLDFAGKPLVVLQLEALKAAGFREIVLIGGKHNIEGLRGVSMKGVKLHVREQKNLDDGMAGGVASASDVFPSGPVTIICSNDIVETAVYKHVRKKVNAKTGYIVGQKVKRYFPGGYIKLKKNNEIDCIVEKPGDGKEPSDLVNLVIHAHPDIAAVYEAIKKTKGSKEDRYERALSTLFSKFRYEVIPYAGVWQPIKFPWHVVPASLFFTIEKGRAAQRVEIAKSAHIRGHVVFGKGVRVFDNAVIQGPAYIGDHTVIGNNTLVREAHIGRNCVIGFGSEVARSHIGDRVWTHTNYIGDSVIGSNVSFGAGTVTGNLRLDEGEISVNIKGSKMNSGVSKLGLITGDHIRVGVNTSFMPGVKIGSNSFIGAGIVVAQDVPAGSYVTGDWKLKVAHNKTSAPRLHCTMNGPLRPSG